ncbi:Sodium/calcium exchanger protein [Popillia japonica]|uniref:Sodium/calcium exchanger protein n=1 Tax=Popillia japonica TaxID=7064 RepID=A0AAW1L9Q0_POPJA
MRRTRRHKFFQISLLFLLYSILHVYSQRSKGVEVEEETVSSTAQSQLSPEILTKTKGNISGAVDTVLKASSNLLNGSVTVTPSTNTPSTPVISTITTRKPTTQESLLHRPTVHTIQKPTTPAPVTARQTSQPKTEIPLSSPTTPLGRTTVPTLRPKRNNCTPPAIEQFPRPLMGPQARRHGGIIIHVLVAVYTFIGLAIVCDEYFVASLDRICEELKLSPDVAGATFMAAGSSAPELATVIIGVFFAKDDIGISGVIGSAVFNIMFVISVCALCTNTVCYLNWWPLVRDCFFYAVSILVMLFTIYNETISWGESLFMLCMYVVYCIVLHFNPQLERWAQTLPVPCKNIAREEASGLVSYKTLDEEKKRNSYGSPDRSIDNLEQVDMTSLSGPALNQTPTQQILITQIKI